MPHLAQKAHRRRIKRIVLWELQLGGEDAAFKGGAVGALDEGFPEKDVVFGDGAGGDAVRGGGGEEFVFLEEAAGRDCGGHGDGLLRGNGRAVRRVGVGVSCESCWRMVSVLMVPRLGLIRGTRTRKMHGP